MYCHHLQLEGAKKTRRLHSAILWVRMGCPISAKCLDNHWIPESSLGPTDKRVDRGGACHISEPEKTICVEPSRNLFWVPSHVLSSLSGSYPWSGLSGILSWDGVRASLQTAVLGLLDLTKSLLICANSLGAIFSIYSNKCQLLLFSASNHLSWRYSFVWIRSQVQRVKLTILLSL